MSIVKVLIVDDEERMRRLVSDFLKRQGYLTLEAGDGKKALEVFYQNETQLSLVVLDVMMPFKNGWEVLKEIRSVSSVPVIMLTAKSEEADELNGFNSGADEYVTKPFSPMILVARIQALLKRAGKLRKSSVSYGNIRIDAEGHSVYSNNVSVELTPKEYELLLYLTDNENIALTREMILNSVWSYDYFGDVRTVDTHIKKLRLKLGECGYYIQTIRGLGYKFVLAGNSSENSYITENIEDVVHSTNSANIEDVVHLINTTNTEYGDNSINTANIKNDANSIDSADTEDGVEVEG